jgi:hypothetical protein
MKQKAILHPISFGKATKTWSREKFIRQLSSQFPDHDIESCADALGLVSEAVAGEAPPAIPPRTFTTADEAREAGRREGAEDAALLKDFLNQGAEVPATSSKTSKPKGGKK